MVPHSLSLMVPLLNSIPLNKHAVHISRDSVLVENDIIALTETQLLSKSVGNVGMLLE